MINRISEELVKLGDGRRGERTEAVPVEETWTSRLTRWLHQSEDVANRHPGAILFAAVAVGIALGWWIKRR